MADSYFGSIGNSFYAGPNGESFQIKAWFSNKKELNDSIGNAQFLVGDYVGVTYGSREDGTYDSNLATDNEWYGQNYNATLWRKVKAVLGNGETSDKYTELVVNFQCSPINISISRDETRLADPTNSITTDDPDMTRQFIIKDNTSTPTDQKFKHIPIKPWEVAVGNSFTMTPADSPTVVINRRKNSTSTVPLSSSDPATDNTTKYIHFGIPPAWQINSTVGVSSVDPGEVLTASFNNTPGSSTEKKLNIDLPKPWTLKPGTISVTDPGALIENRIKATITDNNTTDSKDLNLWLPKAWDIKIATSDTCAVDTNPSVEIVNTGSTSDKTFKFTLPVAPKFNNPTVTYVGSDEQNLAGVSWAYADPSWKEYINLGFTIPRGTRIVVGNLLDTYKRSAINTSATLSGYNETLKKGDLYISSRYGTIWKVTAIGSNNSYTVVCQGVAQLPVPEISQSSIGAPNSSPSVTLIEPTGDNIWGLDFALPRAPRLIADSDNIKLVGPNATNAGVSATTDTNGDVSLQAIIPRGSRIFTGPIDNILSYDAEGGDLFLDTLSWNLYQYTKTGNILGYDQNSIGNIAGKSFEIKGDPIVVFNDTLSGYVGEGVPTKISNYLFATLTEKPAPLREIVVVTHVDKANEEAEDIEGGTPQTTYWFYWVQSGADVNVGYFNYFQVSQSAGGSLLTQTNPVNASSVENGTTITFTANGILALKNDLNAKIAHILSINDNPTEISSASTTATFNGNQILALRDWLATRVQISMNNQVWGSWSYDNSNNTRSISTPTYSWS